MKSSILFIAISVFLFAACKKGDNTPSNPIDQLPPATQTGANTLGCLVNGKPFTAYGKPSFLQEQGIYFIPFSKKAWLIDGTSGHQDLSMKFDFNKNPNVPGTFEMSDNYPAGAEFLNPLDGNTAITGSNDFKTDSIHKGTLTVQYYDSTIIAGIFSFDCANDSGVVIHITKGRFDISIK